MTFRFTSTPQKTETLALYRFHEHHTLKLTRDDVTRVTCETCSIPATIAAAVKFMYSNGVISLTVDGAPLKRI